MATVNYNEWNEWNILPLSKVTLTFANTNNYHLSTMEAASEFKIGYVLEDNDMGGKTPVAVKVEGNITVVQNNIKDFKQLYLDALSSAVTRVWLYLYNPQTEDKIIDVNGTPQYGQDPRDTLTLENWEVIPDFTANNLAPQIKLNIRGFLGLEIITTHFDLLFQQSWS